MSGSDSEDELDRLTRTFEAQAHEDCVKVLEAKAQAKRKTVRNMRETREEGLQAPISENTKGFQMLAKMGYKKGSGLGKGSIGQVEPINLVLKEKRTGLGLDEDRKQRQDQVLEEQLEREVKRRRLGQEMQKDFAGLQSAKMSDRQYEGQIKSARQIIETLDARKGIERNFMWPPVQKEEEEESEKKEDENEKISEPTWEDQPAKTRLLTVLTYLRMEHFYCLHCGCQYDDPGDLEQNCPGLMEMDH